MNWTGSCRGPSANGCTCQKNASREVLYLKYKDGGDICAVVQAQKMPHSNDTTIDAIARSSLQSIACRNTNNWRPDAICNFLNDLYGPDIGFDGGDISSVGSRARTATRKMARRIDIKWVSCNNDIQITIDGNIVQEKVEYRLRSAFKTQMLQKLLAKPDQGKTYDVSSR